MQTLTSRLVFTRPKSGSAWDGLKAYPNSLKKIALLLKSNRPKTFTDLSWNAMIAHIMEHNCIWTSTNEGFISGWLTANSTSDEGPWILCQMSSTSTMGIRLDSSSSWKQNEQMCMWATRNKEMVPYIKLQDIFTMREHCLRHLTLQ